MPPVVLVIAKSNCTIIADPLTRCRRQPERALNFFLPGTPHMVRNALPGQHFLSFEAVVSAKKIFSSVNDLETFSRFNKHKEGRSKGRGNHVSHRQNLGPLKYWPIRGAGFSDRPQRVKHPTSKR
jgi:hypothetical protein